MSGTITNSGADTAADTVSIYDSIGSGVTSVTENSATSTLVLGSYGAGTTTGTNSFGALNIDAGTVIIKYAGDQGAGTISFASSAGGTATLNASSGSAFSGPMANAISVSGSGMNVLEATNYSPTFSGNITLNSSSLVLEANNGSISTLTETGGVSGTGNLDLQVDAGATSAVVVGGSSNANMINNVGTITNDGTAGGTSTIDEVIGSNVTNVIENSATSALTINGGNGANAFSGSLEIESGTVNLQGNNSVASTGTIDLGTTSAAATLNWISGLQHARQCHQRRRHRHGHDQRDKL